MVSIIIPTLNEEKALPETLHHVLQQAGTMKSLSSTGAEWTELVR